MRIYEFRNFFLNSIERQVIRIGNRVGLTPRTFDVLELLIERAGEIVTKDEMLGSVWNGRFVEEGNLAVQISKLRKALDESKAARFIETIQGVGYRFIAPVRRIKKEEWQIQVNRNGKQSPTQLSDLLDEVQVSTGTVRILDNRMLLCFQLRPENSNKTKLLQDRKTPATRHSQTAVMKG